MGKAKRTGFLTILLLLLNLASHAQDYGVPSEWGAAHINNVYLDNGGKLWMATDEGLQQPLPEGVLRTWYPELTAYANCIMDDGHGTLWIGNTNGLLAFTPHNGRMTPYPIILSGRTAPVSSIAKWPGNERLLLLSTTGYGLRVWNTVCNQLDTVLTHRLNALLRVQDHNLHRMHIDAEGHIWALSHNRITVIDLKSMKRIDLPELAQHEYLSLAEDTLRKRMYLAGPEGGLTVCHLPSMQMGRLRISVQPVSSLLITTSDNLLLGTDNAGLYTYNAVTGELVPVVLPTGCNPLSKWKVHHMAMNVAGDLCLGLYQHGLMVLPATTDGFAFHKYDMGAVTALAKVGNNIAVGADGKGLRIGENTYNTRNSALGSNSVLALQASEHGELYVGTFFSGLYAMQNGRIEPVDTCIKVMGLACDTLCHRLYAATNGDGVLAYDTRTHEPLNNSNGTRHMQGEGSEWTTSVAVDYHGTLWIGQNKGVHRHNIVTGKGLLLHEKGKRRFRVNQIVAHGNDIWVASTLGLLHAETNDSILTLIAGCNEEARSVMTAKNGTAWFTTLGTVWRVTRDGAVPYRPQAALHGAGFFTPKATTITTDGRILFGCEEGVLEFNPDEVIQSDNRKELAPMFMCITVEGKELCYHPDSAGCQLDAPIDYATRLTLFPESPSFSVTLAPSTLCTASDMCIEYMLQGHDQSWHRVMAATTPTASYSALSSGEYTFVARIIDSDSGKILGQRQISVEVMPPWWGTWWARLFFLLLFAIIVTAIVHEVMERRRRREQVRRIRLKQQ